MNKFIIVLMSFLMFSYSYAQTNKTATNKVTATLVSSCIIAADSIAIGDMTANGSNGSMVYGSGFLNVTCSNGLAYSISMNNGLYSTTNRYMKGAMNGQYILYSMCMTPSWNSSANQCTADYWGQDYAHMLKGVGNGNNQSLPMYAFVPRGYYSPDNYSDTMTATLYY